MPAFYFNIVAQANNDQKTRSNRRN